MADCLYGRCAEPAVPNRRMCVKHLRQRAEAAREYRKDRKMRGRCTSPGCGRRICKMSKSRCAGCLETNRKAMSALYEGRQRAGRCRQCDEPLARQSKSRCEKHLRMAREDMAKRRVRRAAL